MTETPFTVVVIDNDPLMRDALNCLLRSAGYRVELFPSAETFLAGVRSANPSCLVLDVRLPGLNGLDLQCELLRTHVYMPIVFITGHADVPTAVRALKAGAVHFLTKPFTDEELLDAIQEARERDGSERCRDAELQSLRVRIEQLTAREREVM